MRVTSLQPHSDTVKQGAFRHVTLRADLTGDIEGVRHLLASLESGLTLLRVRELAIAQTELVPIPGRAEALRVQISVDGLMPSTPTVRVR
jgi:hypothetical protein